MNPSGEIYHGGLALPCLGRASGPPLPAFNWIECQTASPWESWQWDFGPGCNARGPERELRSPVKRGQS